MADIEKVIKGLNDIGGFVAGRIGIKQARNFIRTIDDACAMLKEQEPMQVKMDMYGNAYCPWCSTDKIIEMGVQRLHLGTKFCPYCGQAVKWE